MEIDQPTCKEVQYISEKDIRPFIEEYHAYKRIIVEITIKYIQQVTTVYRLYKVAKKGSWFEILPDASRFTGSTYKLL
ncbi:MAG: hypothetical protein P857_316 [Candidatus Xenolissoclinum pacificiensis L6]|uniref:Uncharacterized protein n=1 Tax=Candidatus Xenolissoclinum pacificiensis L6 TaxID=1401685 RepID=W2UZ34_9RICK|nr:MAG: hypothetical protein P857_316 [Candidatus Xenolissoclinum pacificiensis L6]